MAWDATKPATSGYLVSADIRANWLAAQAALFAPNLLADPTFLIWAAGDSAAPAHWALSGAGAAIARAGTGLGDTARKVGLYCAKVTAGGGAAAYLAQNVLDTSSYDDAFDARVVSAGAWVKCAAASSARVYIGDGAASTTSSYHSGGGGWEFLSLSRTISASATYVAFGLEVAAGIAAYISGPTVVLGPVPPLDYMPSPCVYGAVGWEWRNTVTTGTNKGRRRFGRPTLVKDVVLYAATAPTGQALICDVNHWDGAAFQSMFSTRPQIADGAYAGGAQPDGTYRYRCFTGSFGSTIADGLMDCDVDQVGSVVAGADLTVEVRCLQFARWQEPFLVYNAVA